ncbi:MAG: cell division protein ZapD [Gammaproteobacteria bacterium]
MSSLVSFEQPLNERMRTFMRVEQLYSRCQYYIEKEEALDSHSALSALLELMGLVSRGDLKRELMKEVKRQLANLQQLHSIPSLDQNKLEQLVSGHSTLINELDNQPGQLVSHLKDNDFINSIKQRAAIPGGTCDFDLPSYHYWLTQPPAKRKETIQTWLQPFDVVYKTVVHCLELIRNSSEIESCEALKGFYQKNLDQNQPNQLIRVLVDTKDQCFPEISAGKHRFSIRFLEQANPNQYPKQVERDITFKIACCAF